MGRWTVELWTGTVVNGADSLQANREGSTRLKTWTYTQAFNWVFFPFKISFKMAYGPAHHLQWHSIAVTLLFLSSGNTCSYPKAHFKPWGIWGLHLTATTAPPPIPSSATGTHRYKERETYVLQSIKHPETPNICMHKQKMFFNMCF